MELPWGGTGGSQNGIGTDSRGANLTFLQGAPGISNREKQSSLELEASLHLPRKLHSAQECRCSGSLPCWPCPRQGFAAELQPERLLGLKSKAIKGSSFWPPFPETPGLWEPVALLCSSGLGEGTELSLNALLSKRDVGSLLKQGKHFKPLNISVKVPFILQPKQDPGARNPGLNTTMVWR